jgi:hypothetical protein
MRSDRTFDAVTVRALPDGGFVVSAPAAATPVRECREIPGGFVLGAPAVPPDLWRHDIVAFGDIEGVIAWLDNTVEPKVGFIVNL